MHLRRGEGIPLTKSQDGSCVCVCVCVCVCLGLGLGRGWGGEGIACELVSLIG